MLPQQAGNRSPDANSLVRKLDVAPDGLVDELTEARARAEELSTDKLAQQAYLRELQQQTAELGSERDDLVSDRDRWRTSHEQLESKLDDQKLRIAALTKELRALQGMQVPAWAGKISSDNPYRFRLRICKDGRVDKVLRKGSTGDSDLDATLAHEISRLDLPAIPPKQAAGMTGSCAVLDYTFAWKASGVG